MIEVKHLCKSYGHHEAVKELNFVIPDGKIYGFLGPNGAGKSTTMNMMTGYLAPTSGEIWIDGISMQEDPEAAKKQLGYLPEVPPLYTEMTVEEYLCFCAELKKINKFEIEENVQEVVDATQLNEVSHRLIRNLSKGYRQRVGLAQAMLGNPKTIILDEPMVGLDPKQIIEIRELIRSLSKNRTVLMSSHILSEISAVCDHIMILSEGELVASDTPENLEKRFASSGELKLSLKTDKKTCEKMLSGIKSVHVLEILQHEDSVSARCTLSNTKQDCELIFYACVTENVPIYQIEMQHASLEDVFLKLTERKEEEDD